MALIAMCLKTLLQVNVIEDSLEIWFLPGTEPDLRDDEASGQSGNPRLSKLQI